MMEGRWCCMSLLVQLVVFIACASVSHCTLPSEIEANRESVRFDEIYVETDWKSQDAFITAVTQAVNTYCSNSTNLASCQLTAFTSNSSFTVMAIGETGFTYINGDIKIDFYVLFPDSGVDTSGANEFVLVKSTVTTILEANEAFINNATGSTLVFIGNKRLFGIDNYVNMIMIPVSIVLFLIVVLLAIVLHCIHSRGEKHQQLISSNSEGSNKKGEEAITLTAMKTTGYDEAAGNESKDPKPAEEVKA